MKTNLRAALPAVMLALGTVSDRVQALDAPYAFTTLAGKAYERGHKDGSLEVARFNQPAGLAMDQAGNLYVVDSKDNVVRKISKAGQVTTLAGMTGTYGTSDGTGNQARFGSIQMGPQGLAVDSAGTLYVSDTDNYTIRKITPTGVVTTFAGLAGHPGSLDGQGHDARLIGPWGLAVDTAGNVYVADSRANSIRKITPGGLVSTLAGGASSGRTDGIGAEASFLSPYGVTVDRAGNVCVADCFNYTIRSITPQGKVTTLAGMYVGERDGTGNEASFGTPWGLAVDGAGNLFVSDNLNQTIRKVTPAGTVTTLAGLSRYGGSSDGIGSSARFASPKGVAVDNAGNVYVADSYNATIRKGRMVPMIISSGTGFDGHFGFNLIGPAGQAVVVEVSHDLLNWQPLWTNQFSGTLSFTDKQSGGSAPRFYRARTP